MAKVFREYERRKEASGAIDFEDLLELTVRLYEEDEHALAALRERYAAFTVDEYQDVNLLQQSLLELWLGPRDDLCAVGDDYQSIYGFTGASPQWLLGLATRFPQATVVRLEENYRSSPQVLALANRLVPRLGGAEKTLARHAARGTGAGAARLRLARGRGRLRALACPRAARRGRAVRGDGRPDAAERALGRLRGAVRRRARPVPGRGAARPRRRAAAAEGPARRGLRLAVRGGAPGRRAAGPGRPWSRTRSASASSSARPTSRACASWPRSSTTARRRSSSGSSGSSARFAHGAQGGVHLLTLHRAKGLEFDAVFLPRVEEKELPCKAAMRRPAQVAEERRLLYVGMTRAKRHLALTWAGQAEPLPARARRRGSAAGRCAQGAGRGAGRPDLRRAEGVAPEALEGRRDPGVCRLPQLDAGRDRLAPADRRSPSSPRCRASGPRSSSATVATC